MVAPFKNILSRATQFTYIDPVTRKERSFLIDSTITLQTNLSAKVTSFPVEGGGNITDHVQASPLTLQINGVISESPSQQLLTIASSLVTSSFQKASTFNGLSATFTSAFLASAASRVARGKLPKDTDFSSLLTERRESDPEYPKRAMLGLTRAFERGTTFSIRTYFSDDIYKNMVITSLKFTQNSKIGDSLSFTMNMVKIVKVASFAQTKGEIQIADPTNASATAEGDQGKNSGEKPPSSAYGGIDSLLKDLGGPGLPDPT